MPSSSLPPHPRLFLSAEQVADLAALCGRDDWSRRAWEEVRSRCDEMLCDKADEAAQTFACGGVTRYADERARCPSCAEGVTGETPVLREAEADRRDACPTRCADERARCPSCAEGVTGETPVLREAEADRRDAYPTRCADGRARRPSHAEGLTGETPVLREAEADRRDACPTRIFCGGDRWRRGLDRDIIVWLAFAHLVTRDGRYGQRAVEAMRGLAGLSCWGRPTDEVSFALALGYDWLHDLLDEDDRRLIRQALVTKGLTAYLSAVRDARVWDAAPPHWRAALSGSASVTAMALLGEEPAADEALAVARREMDRVLDAMPEDGGWPDGLSCWALAVTYLAYHAAGLESVLGEGLDIILRDAVRETGYFAIFFLGSDGRAADFGDCGLDMPEMPALHYLARRTGRLELSAFRDRCAPRAHPFDLLWRDARASSAAISDETLRPSRAFRATEWAALRSTWDDERAVYLAIKGGQAGAQRSRRDVGAFVLVARGERFGCEPHAGDRAASARAHNTLTIEPDGDQCAGAAGTIEEFLWSPFISAVRLDCAGAFGGRVRAWHRDALLIAGEYVVLVDEVLATEDAIVEWRMHTPCAAKVSDGAARLIGDRSDLAVKLLAFSAEPKVEPMPDDFRKLPECATGMAKADVEFLSQPDGHVLGSAAARPRALLLAVLFPVAKGEAAPEIEGLAADNVVGVRVSREDATDRLLINVRGAGGGEAAGIYFEGHQALVRRCDSPGDEGTITHAVVRDGLALAADRELMLGTHGVCTVILDQSALHSKGRCSARCLTTGADALAFTVWAESASAAVNGKDVEAEIVGGMVSVELPAAGEHEVEVRVE